jgi:hypothetical protein
MNSTSRYVDGAWTWFLDDKIHRVDGPAVIRDAGTKEWYINGMRHRADGAAIEYSNGLRSWYFNGNLHRIGGPAIEMIHEDAKLWYIYGVRYKNIHDYQIAANLSDEDTMILKLKYNFN